MNRIPGEKPRTKRPQLMGKYTRTGTSQALLPCCTGTAANTEISIAQKGAGGLQGQGMVSSPSVSQPGEAKDWYLTRETALPAVYLALPSFHFLIRLSTLSKKSTCCATSAIALAFFFALGCLVMANCSASYLYHSIYSLLFVPHKSLTGL